MKIFDFLFRKSKYKKFELQIERVLYEIMLKHLDEMDMKMEEFVKHAIVVYMNHLTGGKFINEITEAEKKFASKII